jgi:hypothetical protein
MRRHPGGAIDTIYLLHFDRPARHYLGNPARSALLKVGCRAAGGEFAGLGRLLWPGRGG